MKIAIIGCGLMGSGVASLAAPEAELILIDRDLSRAEALASTRGGTASADLSAAADADVIAAVLPAPAVADTFLALAGLLRRGAIALDMATKGAVPPEAKAARPDVTFAEAKIIGSGIGVSLGLKAMLVTDLQEGEALRAVRGAFPGFADVARGDPGLVPAINARGAYHGIRAAVEAEEELRRMGLPETWIQCASGCLVPGSVIGLSQNRMGEFNRRIAEQVRQELREKERPEAE